MAMTMTVLGARSRGMPGSWPWAWALVNALPIVEDARMARSLAIVKAMARALVTPGPGPGHCHGPGHDGQWP